MIDNETIEGNVFAQIGHSDYSPRNFQYTKFLSAEEYENAVLQSDVVITHGGTGAIVKALKAGKQVITVPRRKKYCEHVDDHQLQIVVFFTDNGYTKRVDEMSELESVIKSIYMDPIEKRFRGEGRIIEIIDDFIIESI